MWNWIAEDAKKLKDAEAAKKKALETTPPICYHTWKKYVGLTHIYEFCDICDKKRPYVEPIKPDLQNDQ